MGVWSTAKKVLRDPPDQQSPLGGVAIVGATLLIAFVVVDTRDAGYSMPLVGVVAFLVILLLNLLGLRALCEHIRAEEPEVWISERVQRLARRIGVMAVIVPLMAVLAVWMNTVDMEWQLKSVLLSLLLVAIVGSVGRGITS